MRVLIILTFVLLLGSCTLELELDAPATTPELVVNSIAEAYGDSLVVQVWESTDILSNVSDLHITDARVSLYADDRYLLDLVEINDPNDQLGEFYYSPVPNTLSPGTKYTIEVNKDGYPVATAEEVIEDRPLDFAASSVCRKCFCEYDESTELTTVTVTIADEPGPDYYHLIINYSILIYDFVPEITSSRARVFGEYFESNSPVFEDHIVNGPNRPLVFTDELFDGNTQTISFTVEDGPAVAPFQGIYCNNDLTLGAQIEIELRRVSEAYYNYYNTVTLQDQALDNPFAEPVQVFNNIRGGKGIFGSYGSVKMDIDVSSGD